MWHLRVLVLLTVAATTAGCALASLGGTVDRHVRVTGTLRADASDKCSIRFVSSRTDLPRSAQPITGEFVAGLMLHSNDALSDFHAELSCNSLPWRTVGPADAFGKRAPVQLGTIGP